MILLGRKTPSPVSPPKKQTAPASLQSIQLMLLFSVVRPLWPNTAQPTSSSCPSKARTSPECTPCEWFSSVFGQNKTVADEASSNSLTSSSIHVLGQNGLTVDGQDIAPGAAHHFTTTSAASASSSSRVELDFYGDFTLTVHLAAEETHHHQQVVRLQDPLPSPLAVPSSSPSLRPQQLDNDQQEEEEDNFSLGAPAEVKQPEAPTATTPEADLCSEPPTFEFDYSLQPDEDALSDLSDAEESAAAAAAHQTPLSDELVGLLAQMLVFHGKTTVPTSDVLAALCDDGDDRHNADMVMDTLRRGPFGVVENPKLKVSASAGSSLLMLKQCGSA